MDELGLFVTDLKYGGDEIQIGDARHEFIKIGVIGNIGELAFKSIGILFDGQAIEGDFAFFEPMDADDAFDGRGFAGSVGTDESIDIAIFDFEIDVVDGFVIAIMVGFG